MSAPVAPSHADSDKSYLSLSLDIDNHITTLLPPSPTLAPLLKSAQQHATTNSLPPISVSPLQGTFLSTLCTLMQARRILEIGTLGGYSTLHFLSTGAHVTSIEIDPKHARVARENCQMFGNMLDVVDGAALDVMARMVGDVKGGSGDQGEGEGKAGEMFDFVFIDADWGEQSELFDLAVKLTRVGGGIVVDNVVRNVIDGIEEGGDVSVDGIEENEGQGQGRDKGGKGDKVRPYKLFERVGKDERVNASMVTTVSGKKGMEMAMRGEVIDGFLIAVVKGH